MHELGQKTIHARILASVLAGFHSFERRQFQRQFRPSGARFLPVKFDQSGLHGHAIHAGQFDLCVNRKIAKGFSRVIVASLSARHV